MSVEIAERVKKERAVEMVRSYVMNDNASEIRVTLNPDGTYKIEATLP